MSMYFEYRKIKDKIDDLKLDIRTEIRDKSEILIDILEILDTLNFELDSCEKRQDNDY